MSNKKAWKSDKKAAAEQAATVAASEQPEGAPNSAEQADGQALEPGDNEALEDAEAGEVGQSATTHPIEAAADKPAKPAKGPRRLTAEDLRKRGYVEAEKEYPAEEGYPDGYVVIVTKGSRKLKFPGDEEKAGAMALHELDGSVPVNNTPKTFLGRPKLTAEEKQVKA